MTLEVILPPEEERKDRFSYSRAAAWLRCGKAYDYQYNQSLIPVINTPTPYRGTLVHFGLNWCLRFQHYGKPWHAAREASELAIRMMWERWANKEKVKNFLMFDDTLRQDAENLRDEAICIADRVIQRYQLDQGGWKTFTLPDGTPCIEKDFEFDGFTCRPDWVAYDPDGKLWLLDFKLHNQLQPVEYEEWNLQAGCYQHVLKQHGIQVLGSCAFQIRAAVPKIPALNKTVGKDGSRTMSRSSIATDWNTYKSELIRQGLDPDDYMDMRNKLQDFERLSFHRRTDTEAENIYREVNTLLSFQKLEIVPIFRSLKPINCNRCDYKDFCLEELRGRRPEPYEFNLTKEGKEDSGTDN